MDVTKELVCINFCYREQLIMFRSGNMIIIGTQCQWCILITESLNFKTATLLKLGLNYS